MLKKMHLNIRLTLLNTCIRSLNGNDIINVCQIGEGFTIYNIVSIRQLIYKIKVRLLLTYKKVKNILICFYNCTQKAFKCKLNKEFMSHMVGGWLILHNKYVCC